MSQLDQLAQHRDAILLAEIAGLLHNIGKLDVNFLEISVDGSEGQIEIRNKRLEIPDYCFDRFAVPDVNLLSQSIRHDFERLVSQDLKREEKEKFENELSNHFLASATACPRERLVDAIWKFYLFKKGNGPLYICHASRRESEFAPLEREIEDIEQFDVQSIPPQERQSKLVGLKNKRIHLENRLERTRQSILQDEQKSQGALEAQFQPLVLDVANENHSLSQLLTLFWDDFFYRDAEKGKESDYQRASSLAFWLKAGVGTTLPMLLVLAHGEMSGSEKGSAEKQKPTWKSLRLSSPFGYETELKQIWEFHKEREHLINNALDSGKVLKNDEWRLRFQATLRHGLGDTQRPINEITLWDYASSIAALFKTSIAKSFLEGQVADANQMHWRLLGVRFDGLDYILQADRIADLVGRQQKYGGMLDQISIALTQETPIASQVYQDESGLFFVVPDSDKLQLEDMRSLIKQQLQKVAFADLQPNIDWSENQLRGKQLNLGKEIKRQDDVKRPSINPETVYQWWRNSSTQICEVCGLRPAISKEIKHCAVCRDTRQGRVQTWIKETSATIWLDEVADRNGRLALLTGHFPLNDWLDGTLVESLALGMDKISGKPVSKFASFPRVQRIWQTTQTFWQEAQANANQTLTDARRRLTIQLANQLNLTPYQVYELDLHGRSRMSVLWDGQHLISTDNLSYTAVQLGTEKEKRQTPDDAALAVGAWLDSNKQKVFQLISDDERNKRFDIQIVDITYQDAAYAATIPILAQPRTFMTLVPADKALDIVAAIQTKYEREMGKVRNRLPLHLGLVYFHRRTPLRAALDAGRRMLNYELGIMKDEVWHVTGKFQGPLPNNKKCLAENERGQFTETVTVKLEQNGRSLTWHVPTVMGDSTTPDNWYPYVFIQSDKEGNAHPNGRSRTFKALRPKNDGTTEECWLIHAAELQEGDEVYFTPATLDFQWLDSTARRFEIAYDKNGRRHDHLIRPYLLDQLNEIEEAWGMLQSLSKNQLYALRDTIEQKRAEWFEQAKESLTDQTFGQFCADVVHNTKWKTAIDREKLTRWAINGLLADTIQLHVSIMKQELKPPQEEQPHE